MDGLVHYLSEVRRPTNAASISDGLATELLLLFLGRGVLRDVDLLADHLSSVLHVLKFRCDFLGFVFWWSFLLGRLNFLFLLDLLLFPLLREPHHRLCDVDHLILFLVLLLAPDFLLADDGHGVADQALELDSLALKANVLVGFGGVGSLPDLVNGLLLELIQL